MKIKESEKLILDRFLEAIHEFYHAKRVCGLGATECDEPLNKIINYAASSHKEIINCYKRLYKENE